MSVKIYQAKSSGNLSGYVPYTGATQNVDLGVYGIIAEYLAVNTSGTTTAGVGSMVWNGNEGTIEFKLQGGNVTLQVGQENVQKCRNEDAVDMVDGDVVYMDGSTGNRPNIYLANNSDPTHCQSVIGVVTESIKKNNYGFVTTYGIVHDLNTNAFNEGDSLWLDVNGDWTNVRPTAPSYAVFIGIVLKKSGADGHVFVCPRIYPALSELSDVSVANLVQNDLILWDDNNSYFANKTTKFNGVLDGTSVSGTASATITLSQLIPANTFSSGDIIRVRARFRKSVLNGNSNFIISINTSNSLVGATSLALMTANTRFAQMKRDFYIKSSTSTEVYASAVAVTNDDNVQATAVSTPNINWSVAQYMIFSITQGATDTAIGSGYSIEKVWGTK